ncbi:MAG: methylenetetrahydrofolate reductase [Thermoplasmata archaeon]|nr:methylenetetrahydrofolate reductase [Thermoplasmata archaeon]
MKVSDILETTEETRFSLEVYPPKTSDAIGSPRIQQHLSAIFDTLEHLRRHNPAFVSVTYNPEGKTRTTSIPLAAIIKQRFKVESVAHLTCIATPRAELAKTLNVLDYLEIDNILALRGDRPPNFVSQPDGLEYASELVRELMRHNRDFCIGVAGYPEGHLECVTETGERDLDADLKNFKKKVDQGASFSISQLFLDNQVYFDFVRRARKAGVDIPIIPGIMPIMNLRTLDIIKGLCGASVPKNLEQKIENHRNDPKEIMAIGIEQSIYQCKRLMDRVPCIHFYTMDRWEPTGSIIEALR